MKNSPFNFASTRDLNVGENPIGGRGGIRTHGGLPHARFRVECLKPDSATLPGPHIVDVNLGRAIIRRGTEFAKAKHQAGFGRELDSCARVAQLPLGTLTASPTNYSLKSVRPDLPVASEGPAEQRHL